MLHSHIGRIISARHFPCGNDHQIWGKHWKAFSYYTPCHVKVVWFLYQVCHESTSRSLLSLFQMAFHISMLLFLSWVTWATLYHEWGRHLGVNCKVVWGSIIQSNGDQPGFYISPTKKLTCPSAKGPDKNDAISCWGSRKHFILCTSNSKYMFLDSPNMFRIWLIFYDG